MSENKIKGDFGEESANSFLRKKNVIILEKNFRTRSGEIDIIGLFNNTIIFYEVKTRKSDIYGSPAEAVTRSKINKIKLTSKFYMAKFNLYNYDVRYDVIEVYLNKNLKLEKINIIENAF
ncbi:MAG: YraN family protein [Clostridiaceae bacterium]